MTETHEPTARYASLGKTKEKLVPLAFTISGDTPALEHTSVSVGWTSAGFDAFGQLRKALGGSDKQRSLPHRALIALLEMYVPHITRLDSKAGLYWKPYDADIVRFAWTDATHEEVEKCTATAVREWLSKDVMPLIKRDAAAKDSIERVKDQLDTGKIFTIKSEKHQLYPWSQVGNGTTKPTDWEGYTALVDFLARTLEDQVVFEGLPPLRRVVGRPGFGAGNKAELLTEPITDVAGEPFSLRLDLKVVSMPGVQQPVVLMDVGKRRWVRRLDAEPFGKTTISGYAFPKDYPLAVRFSMEAKNRKYELGEDYYAIQRRYRLKGGLDGPAVAGGEANNERIALYVNYRNGYGKHSVKAGVPELDKIEVFEKIEEILSPLGFQVWNPLERVKTKHGSARESGLVNAKVLKQEFGLLEDGEDNPTVKMLNTARDIVDLNKVALDHHHTEKPMLVVAYDETCRRDAEFVERTVRYLMGGDLKVEFANLPNGVHGPRYELPAADEREAGKRARARLEAWRPLAESLKKLAEKENIVGCLVIAPKFYEINGERKRDDTVNKPAGRKAIASIARVPVQYLLPNDDDMDGFLTRAQYAWRDLAWAHRGRIDGVAYKVRRLLPGEEAPKEILGITVVQRNDKRAGWKGSLIPVAFKLDVEEGRCFMRFAYDGQGELRTTDWEPIQEALSRVAELSPLTIGVADKSNKTRELRRQRFQKFCETVITESCDAGSSPLVLMHSTHSALYWKWLSDREIDSRNIDFEKGGGTALQEIWDGVRIVRVREDNSPQIILDKEDLLAHVEKNESRKKEEIESNKTTRVPTSPDGDRLYRVESSSFPVYKTIGGKDRPTSLKRGRSCYRDKELLDTRGLAESTDGGLKLRPLGIYEATIGHWPTPNPLELVVAFKQENDDPDAIAELVEGLRFGYGHYGEWSSLPAPLFFERVVRDYIAEFENEEETEEGANE